MRFDEVDRMRLDELDYDELLRAIVNKLFYPTYLHGYIEVRDYDSNIFIKFKMVEWKAKDL